jgi:hypothetical protein
MDQSSAIGNRRSRRSNVLLAASIEAAGVATDVKLRNLSAYGALIVGDSLPERGEAVSFRRKELCVAGRIAWVRDGYAGVAFDEELRPQDVLRHIPTPSRKYVPEHRRPGLASQPLSSSEEEYIRQWFWSPPKNALGD